MGNEPDYLDPNTPIRVSEFRHPIFEQVVGAWKDTVTVANAVHAAAVDTTLEWVANRRTVQQPVTTRQATRIPVAPIPARSRALVETRKPYSTLSQGPDEIEMAEFVRIWDAPDKRGLHVMARRVMRRLRRIHRPRSVRSGRRDTLLLEPIRNEIEANGE